MMKAAARRAPAPPTVGPVVVLVLFFFSGACGLIFENVWSRLLRLVMGNTVLSVTTVLAAFMGGLALGSFLAGKSIGRRPNPLRVYALLEGGIGVYCLLLPILIYLAQPVYRFAYQNLHPSSYAFGILQFVFSGLVLLVPATFMGATFPVLSQFFARVEDRLAWTVGKLYAVNTFGAVAGAFASGFVLIPALGVRTTLYSACAVNLVIATITWQLSRRAQGSVIPAQAKTAFEPPRFAAWILLGYGLSGLAALVYEIAWTRVLSLLVGSSVYAFSLMLTVFIFGLAFGSMALARVLDRRKDPFLWLFLIELGIGVSALAAVPLFGFLPVVVVKLILKFSHSFWLLQGSEFALILGVMFIPTTLMGAAFPLVVRVYSGSPSALARSVGNVYAANTLGSIAGAVCGGFIFIPFFGIQKTIVAAVILNVVVGGVFLVLSTQLRYSKKIALALVATLILLVQAGLTPPWDPAVMSSGAYIYGAQLAKSAKDAPAAIRSRMKAGKLLFYREDITTTVTVRQSPLGERILGVNGKADASSTGDLPTQELLAHAPLLLHPDPQKVLVIGLASGVTLGSAACHPVKSLDCVEISPAMAAASRFFDKINYNVLADPRVHLILADGRNHLALTQQQYDVIISEPSNPWIAGVADLFTREFFQLCHDRLASGGIACVWLQAYSIPDEVFRGIVATFQQVFPHTTIFEAIPMADYLLVGSATPVRVDYGILRHRLLADRVARDLRRIRVDSPAEFLAHIILNGNAVADYVRGARIHTDDNAFAEFAVPLSLHLRETRETLAEELNRRRTVDLSFLEYAGRDKSEVEKLRAQVRNMVEATGHAVTAALFFKRGERTRAIQEAKRAAELCPRGFSFLKEASEGLLVRALALVNQGKLDSAAALCRAATEVTPGFATAQSTYAVILARQGKFAEAVERFKLAAKLEPDNLVVINNLAWLLAVCPDDTVRRSPDALALAEFICQTDGYRNPDFLKTLAAAQAETGNFTQAVRWAEKALKAADTEALADELQTQIDGYRAGKPHRLPQ